MHGLREAGRDGGRGWRGGQLRCKAFPRQRVEQATTIFAAMPELGVALPRIWKETQFIAQRHIACGPESRECRQIVGRGRDQCLGFVALRRLEIAPMLPLEDQHFVRQDALTEHGMPHLVGHRAEILPDDETPVAMALEGKNSQQIFERIRDVRTIGGSAAAGNPEQAPQPHDVVKPQRPGVSHVHPEQLDEGFVRRLRKAMRDERRQTPVLAHGSEGIGWAANRRLQGIDVQPAPDFRPVRGNRDGEIGVQPHTHAGVASCARNCLQLEQGVPLQILIELGAFEMIA